MSKLQNMERELMAEEEEEAEKEKSTRKVALKIRLY